MQNFYSSLLLLALSLVSFYAQSQNLHSDAKDLFPALDNVLYQDGAHAYDDDKVIILSRKNIPNIQSKLLPVKKGDNFLLEVNAHFVKGRNSQVLKRIGTTIAGAAISTLPHLLVRDKKNSDELFEPIRDH